MREEHSVGSCFLCGSDLAPILSERQHWRLVLNINHNHAELALDHDDLKVALQGAPLDFASLRCRFTVRYEREDDAHALTSVQGIQRIGKRADGLITRFRVGFGDLMGERRGVYAQPQQGALNDHLPRVLQIHPAPQMTIRVAPEPQPVLINGLQQALRRKVAVAVGQLLADRTPASFRTAVKVEQGVVHVQQ
jgi:hypothetical protein